MQFGGIISAKPSGIGVSVECQGTSNDSIIGRPGINRDQVQSGTNDAKQYAYFKIPELLNEISRNLNFSVNCRETLTGSSNSADFVKGRVLEG